MIPVRLTFRDIDILNILNSMLTRLDLHGPCATALGSVRCDVPLELLDNFIRKYDHGPHRSFELQSCWPERSNKLETMKELCHVYPYKSTSYDVEHDGIYVHLQHLRGHRTTCQNKATLPEHSDTSAKINFRFLSKKSPPGWWGWRETLIFVHTTVQCRAADTVAASKVCFVNPLLEEIFL